MKDLQAVGAGDELVVPWVGTQLLLVHDVEPRNREREHGAAAAFEEEPQLRAGAHVREVAAAALGNVCGNELVDLVVY